MAVGRITFGELHHQDLQFSSLLLSKRRKKSKTTVCPSSKHARWPWEPAAPQLLFQTVLCKHANSPDCSSASGEKSKAAGADFHSVCNEETAAKNLLLERPTGFAAVEKGELLHNKLCMDGIYEQHFVFGNIKMSLTTHKWIPQVSDCLTKLCNSAHASRDSEGQIVSILTEGSASWRLSFWWSPRAENSC